MNIKRYYRGAAHAMMQGGPAPAPTPIGSRMFLHSATRTRRRADSLPQAIPDWSKLTRGDLVRVARRDGSAITGSIDMLAMDRSVFWVIQEGGRGRVMVCSADKPHVVVLAPSETRN